MYFQIARITSDLNCLKKVNPEAYPETGHEVIDDNIRFYLAVGDLQVYIYPLITYFSISPFKKHKHIFFAEVQRNLEVPPRAQ